MRKAKPFAKWSRDRQIKHAFYIQRIGAKKRGIPFELTFKQWLKIWTDSGHFDERGHNKNQYVMARYGDKGPYAIGNVRITTCSENGREQITIRESSMTDAEKEQRRLKMAGNHYSKGIPHTKEFKAALSAKMKGNKHSEGHKNRLGFKASEVTRERCSVSAENRFAKPEERLKLSLSAKRRYARERFAKQVVCYLL